MLKPTVISHGSGHTKKHAPGKSKKHAHGKAKHNPQHQPSQHHHKKSQPVHVVSHQKQGKKRGLTLDAGPGVCTVEALAASLRLTGRPVSDADVLALYDRVACATDAGACVLCALEAASTWGLGGARPVRWAPASPAPAGLLILGVDLPGPHTVCADGGWWFSWGDRWAPSAWPDAVIEEAWEITWR